jgi:hypothetical protein
MTGYQFTDYFNMRLNYYPETDSLYINLSEQPSVESQEISEGILFDYDAEGRLRIFSFPFFGPVFTPDPVGAVS